MHVCKISIFLSRTIWWFILKIHSKCHLISMEFVVQTNISKFHYQHDHANYSFVAILYGGNFSIKIWTGSLKMDDWKYKLNASQFDPSRSKEHRSIRTMIQNGWCKTNQFSTKKNLLNCQFDSNCETIKFRVNFLSWECRSFGCILLWRNGIFEHWNQNPRQRIHWASLIAIL